jgi:large repetitive protein
MLSGGLACAQTGLIGTYAGTGSAGYSGDGGPATSAMLYGPFGLAVDSNGNLFIADLTYSRIRKVSGGIITTVAGGGTGGDGGLATAAQLQNPCDVKVDSAGNLYISESCVIVSGGSGGGGSGVGGSGGSEVNRIRRVDAATGIITTIAGAANWGFSGDGGPATSALLSSPAGLAIDGSGNIYVADSGNNRVRRIDGVTGVITTVAGNGAAAFAGDGGPATAASLNTPYAVALDSAGNLYIADAVNSRIRRVDAGTGIITTLAGTGSTSYNGDGIPATSANLGLPTALLLNGAGNLLLTDVSNNRVRLVDTSTGLIWTIAGNGTVPGVCCWVGDGLQATQAPVNAPAGVALSPLGLLFVAERRGERVRQVALQSPLISTAVNATASGVSVPYGSPLTLTAVLSAMNGSPANAGGGVLFVDPAGLFTSAPVTNGSASLTISSLQMGAHSIIAQYGGDSVFGGSIAVPISVTITAAQSSVALAANPSPAIAGQPVTLTATVAPSTATGYVGFYNGTTPFGMASVSNGTATLAGATFAAGSYSLTAQYPGDFYLPPSTSPAIALTVKAASSVVVTSSVNPSTAGQQVRFTATLSPSTATGFVQFRDNGTSLGAGTIVSGVARLFLSTLTVGTHSITVVYGGDTNVASATSAALTQTVQTASPVVVVTSSQNPVLVGDPITFTATVTPSAATGTVQFVDGTTVLSTGTLAGGSTTFTTSTLTQGTHSITAVYSGMQTIQAPLPQSSRRA